MVLRLASMASNVGIERLLMQRSGSVMPGLMAALHGAFLLRGFGSSALLAALALPMASAFEGGASAGTYAALALAPLLRGVLHLDYRLAERDLRPGRMALVEGGAALAMVAAVPLSLLVWNDHRVMLLVVLAQAQAQVLLSHLVAQQRDALAFDRAFLAEVPGFGAPLVPNAGLMFLTFQADWPIVAGWYGWTEVALFGVALQLAMLPAQIAGRGARSLPALRLRGLSIAALSGLIGAVAIYLLAGVRFAAVFAICAPPRIALVYSPAFRSEHLIALAFGLAAGARILRTPLPQLAVILGRTGDPARANLWCAAALLPALWAASLALPLPAVTATAAILELLATLCALHLARGVHFSVLPTKAFA